MRQGLWMLEMVLFYAYYTCVTKQPAVYLRGSVHLSVFSYTPMLEAALIGDKWVSITR